jgi:uncharacterized membrane protein
MTRAATMSRDILLIVWLVILVVVCWVSAVSAFRINDLEERVDQIEAVADDD